jgi:hypothetical protein
MPARLPGRCGVAVSLAPTKQAEVSGGKRPWVGRAVGRWRGAGAGTGAVGRVGEVGKAARGMEEEGEEKDVTGKEDVTSGGMMGKGAYVRSGKGRGRPPEWGWV